MGPAGEKASPRSCNTLFLQCAALGLGEGEEGNSCQGAESPTRPAHREGVVYVEGNLPPLEGELLFPVPAHCHQSRHRPRRCRCHRHHLLPAASAAAAAPAAGASSQLLPATAKRRELQHPPPRSTFATGVGAGGQGAKPEGTGESSCVSHHPIPHRLSQSAPSAGGPRPLAPRALPTPHRGRPPGRVQRRGGRDSAASGPPQPVTGVLAPGPTTQCPLPAAREPTADPVLPLSWRVPPSQSPGLQLSSATPPLGGVDPASALRSPRRKVQTLSSPFSEKASGL